MMNTKIERRYHLEKMCDYAAAFEPPATDIHVAEKKRVLFRVGGRPFDALAWIDDMYDLVCITTRTAEMPKAGLEDAVTSMHEVMQICWEHCVAFTFVDKRYEMSMAIFITGLTLEAFESSVMNLVACAEETEKAFKKIGKK